MPSKTEKPTPKKLRDAAKKGQTFKAKDVTTLIVLAVGVLAAGIVVDLRHVIAEFSHVAAAGADQDAASYGLEWIRSYLKMVMPFIVVCAVAGALPSLVQSRFTLATEALKLDFGALDPVAGFKKLFSGRAAKELLKALLHLVVLCAAISIFVEQNHRDLFQVFRASPEALAHEWIRLTVKFVMVLLLCALPVALFDAVFEFFHYQKNVKMEKREVEQERKETEGRPETKMKRRETHSELLSEEVKANVEQSKFIVANPTHIAIGIYMNEDIVPIPFVCVRETNARALAVIRHAEANGVPVVRDVPLARSVYRHSRRYQFVSGEDLEPVMRVLWWLRQVEMANSGARAHTDGGEDFPLPEVNNKKEEHDE
ncbi:EscU/YscU/HrcU family type III secretion system export apparatus switch protein [Pandoraea pulmonicola]|uniref:EscU/YscU/HrcU family type III secretion system export apparatus switch protein n=1 Tax=Pandoraea pulmonicola TaxID=93221 RepID=A0AAJ4ZHL1_PANPU|nr:EscU/YscU/HrcU family type III secretion system export apparatus switch protein [Pandoraea pulmonicola]AJC22359.1 EscU/YscU/HrcU family type III secretion system export apparatus switch protein [Pandoraea pulmonicola]SUD95597.1 Surface presentation of antigens protein spaS [Pandoraea pulmonicola]